MTGRISSATEKALRMVEKGSSIAQAARKCKVSWSTIYRAQVRLGARQKAQGSIWKRAAKIRGER